MKAREQEREQESASNRQADWAEYITGVVECHRRGPECSQAVPDDVLTWMKASH